VLVETFFSNDILSSHPKYFDEQFQLLQKHYDELGKEKQALKVIDSPQIEPPTPMMHLALC
jgi:hypothetical protein